MLLFAFLVFVFVNQPSVNAQVSDANDVIPTSATLSIFVQGCGYSESYVAAVIQSMVVKAYGAGPYEFRYEIVIDSTQNMVYVHVVSWISDDYLASDWCRDCADILIKALKYNFLWWV